MYVWNVLLNYAQVVGEAEKQDGTVNVRTRDELVRSYAIHMLTGPQNAWPMPHMSCARQDVCAKQTTCLRSGMVCTAWRMS